MIIQRYVDKVRLHYRWPAVPLLALLEPTLSRWTGTQIWGKKIPLSG